MPTQSSFLQQRGAAPLPPTQIGEEKAPDRGTAEDSAPAHPIVTISVDPNPQVPSLFRFFVDGVQRTVPIAQVDVNGARVPIHMAHIAAGAMLREDRQLRPHLIKQALVLLLPFQALTLANQAAWAGGDPPGIQLSAVGGIYDRVHNGSLDTQYYSDTSVNMREQGQVVIEAGDLVRTGFIRSKALDRATELMRVLELGLIWELRQQHPNDWILLDGPIAPLTKYARLVTPALQGLQRVANPSQSFNFLRRVIGAVKEIKIVPSNGLEQALTDTGPTVIPVYRFAETVQQQDEIAKEVLSAFVWLRRELAFEISPIWSSISGLARFDIPLPTLLPNDGQTRNTWNTMNDQQIASFLQPNEAIGERLKRLIERIVLERWPVPASTPTRVFVELYPIAETELWLTSSLLDTQEIQARGAPG